MPTKPLVQRTHAFAFLFWVCVICLLPACATTHPGTVPNAIVLPVLPAWFEGKLVRYIVTDVSTPDMARMMNANTSQRLRDALPAGNAKGVRNALERVYKFPDQPQFSVFPSIPSPLGPQSTDVAYSPIWRVVEARWLKGKTVRELKSEEQILAAVDSGDLMLTETDVVINCPVVWVEGQPLLPGSRLLHEPGLP